MLEEKKFRTVDDEIAYNNYKLTADKILQLLSQIREDPTASAKRWVWELLQNAKDVPNRFGKVSVEIELVSQDTLKFRHNGDTFTTKNITGLVQQVSSKDSQNLEGQTGKFGTGFICTHLLSDIIDVDGIVNYMGIDRRFSITLDRSGDRSEALLPRIESTLEELRNIENAYPVVEKYEANRTEQSFDTVFTYHLTTAEKQESANAGLEDLINTLPVTLVTQSQKIKQVRVINRVKGTNVVYICDTVSLGGNVHKSTVKIDDLTKTFLSYITEDVALTAEVKYVDGRYEIIKRDSKHPVLYRDFPLIGSEKFHFPYTLNGFEFNPTERRNGLVLNSADHLNSVRNREIIDKAVEAVLKFNEWLILNNATNRHLLAASRIPKATEEYTESVSLPWIKNLQANWRSQLLDQKLVETENGSDIVRNLSVPAFSTTSTKEVNESFYNLLKDHYIGRGVLPMLKHLHGWHDVVRHEYDTWGTQLKYDKEDFLKDLSAQTNLSTLSLKIGKDDNQTIAWLNDVYKFLVEQNMLNEFDNYAIIPNQEGEFKLLKELKSDHTARIPEILKDIYNSVNRISDSVQHKLMDARVEASVFGNTLLPFSLKEMVEKLNDYVKNGNTCYNIANSYHNQRSEVAYRLIALCPKQAEEGFLKRRRCMYEFSNAYQTLTEYAEIEIEGTDLWKETDTFWFNNSYKKITAAGSTIASVSEKLFVTPKEVKETLEWLDSYLQFYRDNANGDLIKDYAVFPNQQLWLKKLSDLRYDHEVPEEFKDLANYAGNLQSHSDVYRHQLLHPAIKGYEQHNPLKLDEVYTTIKKQFDNASDFYKEIIARHAITILIKQESGEPDEKKIYDFAKEISGHNFDDCKYVEKHTGFNWGFAYEFYIKLVCNKIANSNNLEGFKSLSANFADKTDAELTHWIDDVIEFLHGYKSKKYWKLITDKDASIGIGIWLNQNNDFCRFQDVREDDGILEELKDLTATNPHLAKDYREVLFSLDSSKTSYLETSPLTVQEIAEFVDEKIHSYDGNKQDNNFRSLIFAVGKICATIKDMESYMEYYNVNKNSLIVWSLGEGETMDLVGAIVQQGDEKLKLIKQIVDCPVDKLQEVVEKIANIEKKSAESEEPNDDNTEIEVVEVPKAQEFEVSTLEGKVTVKADHSQYLGLSLEEIIHYVGEAKRRVVKYFMELNDRNPELGLTFNKEEIGMDSYSQLYGIYDRHGNMLPLVVHSYLGPQYRYFDLNWYDWQVLKRPGSMLWVVTLNGGLQCIPLYALPVRQFHFNLEDKTPRTQAIMHILANAGKNALVNSGDDYCISFDFGNNMPTGFNVPRPFDFVPKEITTCINAITNVCEANVPQLMGRYNSGKNIPLITSSGGYSRALKYYEDTGSARDIFDCPENALVAPIIGANENDLF